MTSWTKVEHHPDCPEDAPWAVVDDTGIPEGFLLTEAQCDEVLQQLEGGLEDLDALVESLGGKPNPGTKPDKRLKKPGAMPGMEGDVIPLADTSSTDTAPEWQGVLMIEGAPTGDHREFAVDSIIWPDPQAVTMTLQWQKESSHGGVPTDVTVAVGRIDKIWREQADAGTTKVMGEGRFDTHPDAVEAKRRMAAGMLNGTSINADDITDADIEYIFPAVDGESEEDELFQMLFGKPEKVIYHSARIRATTLCDIPAFIEATLHTIDPNDMALTASAALVALGTVAVHATETSDGTWDGPANEMRLPVRLAGEVAREAYAYVEEGDELGRENTRFLHHEIAEDGTIGAANLTACSTGIGVLHGSRGGSSIPDSARRGVYEHLAAHLHDGGQEPPPYQPLDAVVAHAWHDDYRPPAAWFKNPELGQVTPIIVTDAGRVYGYAAQWGECHLGYMNECVMPPTDDDFTRFMTGEQPLDNGERALVGQITAGIPHASLTIGANKASEHYDNTEAVVADITVGNDKRGIWVAGAVRPSAHSARVGALRASGQVSPDWRRIGGKMRMVGLLTVNVSGYQTPKVRSYVASGELQSLIASGMVSVKNPQPTEITDEELNQRAMRLMQSLLVERVHPKGE